MLKTPISPTGAVDKLLLHHDRSGCYNVKSGYRVLYDMFGDNELKVAGRWNLRWGLQVPPKVKDCLWIMGRNCLPHKVNLYPKKVVEDKWCVLCGAQLEDTWHIFFNCRNALECWDKAGLRDMLE